MDIKIKIPESVYDLGKIVFLAMVWEKHINVDDRVHVLTPRAPFIVCFSRQKKVNYHFSL